MNEQRNYDLVIFIGIFCLIVCWRINIAFGHTFWGGFFALYFGWQGVAAVLGSFIDQWRTRGPRPLSLVPPVWLVAWIVVICVVANVGAPHIGLGQFSGACNYVGWHGWVRTPPQNNCPSIRFFPVR